LLLDWVSVVPKFFPIPPPADTPVLLKLLPLTPRKPSPITFNTPPIGAIGVIVKIPPIAIIPAPIIPDVPILDVPFELDPPTFRLRFVPLLLAKEMDSVLDFVCD